VPPASAAITAAYANRLMRDAINTIRQDDRVCPLLKEMWTERATLWNMQRAFVAIEFASQGFRRRRYAISNGNQFKLTQPNALKINSPKSFPRLLKGAAKSGDNARAALPGDHDRERPCGCGLAAGAATPTLPSSDHDAWSVKVNPF
jgi:hypothetical protein